jgi:hypothetical protein
MTHKNKMLLHASVMAITTVLLVALNFYIFSNIPARMTAADCNGYAVTYPNGILRECIIDNRRLP